jgi:hypothetical protein
MNTHMNNALNALKRSGAVGLPSASDVENAKDGAQWSGKKGSGDAWSLTKNHTDSYNCEC